MSAKGHDRVLLITGASSGIGAATARAAKAAGYRLALVSRSGADSGDGATDGSNDDRTLRLSADVTSWPQLTAATDATVATFGRIDAVFANAGIAAGAWSFIEGEPTPDAWRTMIDTNVLGCALTARAVMPHLLASKGRLVLTGSVLGRYPMAGSLYSATKHAVFGIADVLRAELSGTGVSVSIVEPGPVATAFNPSLTDPDQAPTPLLQADDVARMVVFVLDQPQGVDVNELLLRPHGATP